MAKLPSQVPTAPEKFNVAVQRPTVNVREAENVGEQAEAAARKYKPEGMTFSKHGTFGRPAGHPLEQAWE